VKLAKTGGVVISGDLYHYAEERTLHRMPMRKRAQHSELREMIERFPQGKERAALDRPQHRILQNAISRPAGTTEQE